MARVQIPKAEISLLAARRLDDLMNKTPGHDTAKKVEARIKSVTGRSVGHSTIRRIRVGEVNPTLPNLHDIARAFGLTVADLLHDEPLNVQQTPMSYLERPPAYREILALLDNADESQLLMALGAIRAALVAPAPQPKKTVTCG